MAKKALTFKIWVRDYAVLLVFVAAQIGFWAQTHTIKPDFSIVPEVQIGRAHV